MNESSKMQQDEQTNLLDNKQENTSASSSLINSNEQLLRVSDQLAHVIQELSIIHDFNNVLISQIQSLMSETEKGAYDLMQHIADLQQDTSKDSEIISEQHQKVRELFEYVESKVTELIPDDDAKHKQLRELFFKLCLFVDLCFERSLLSVNKLGEQLNDRINAMFACLQYQDVTRQQSEKIIDGINRLDQHLAEIRDALNNPQADVVLTKSITTHMQEMFEGYVMEQQRVAHQNALKDSAYTYNFDRPIMDSQGIFLPDEDNSEQTEPINHNDDDDMGGFIMFTH